MDFHYTVTTNKSIDEAITALQQNLKKYKFGTLWHLDLTAKLKEKGVNHYTAPYHILEVCNPNEAASVLNDNQLAGYFLPCKIAVYKNKKNETTIGFTRPTVLIGLLESTALESTAEKIEMTLIDVLAKSK
ncbi:DUF302 domain-containing protein [Sporolactobacillus sp. THM7-4]|nr:DUF302 domain-containing protein [Sporolactobacillus sp. THM7-4]